MTFPQLHKRLCIAKYQSVTHYSNIFPRPAQAAGSTGCACAGIPCLSRAAEGWGWRRTTRSTQNLQDLMQPGVAADMPQPFQLLRRFLGAWDSLAMILQEVKGKWNSGARPRPLPLQIQSCPRQCSKIVPVLLEESVCAPAEGGLPAALPGAGVVLVLAVVQRGGRAVCSRQQGQQLLQVRTRGSRSGSVCQTA